MTLATEVNKESFDGNDSATTFDFDFPFADDSWILVSLSDDEGTTVDELVQDTDYTLTNLDEDGGRVSYPISGDPLPTGTVLLVYRLVPLTQPTNYETQKTSYMENFEDDVDRLTMITQQLQEESNRSLKLNVFDPDAADPDDYLAEAQAARDGAEAAEAGAEDAQTAAEAAQSGAETAETGAETAKTNAETAQTGAETAEANALTLVNSIEINGPRNILENESGVVRYETGAIYKFDQWEDIGSMLTGSNAEVVPYKKSLSNVYSGFGLLSWYGNGLAMKVGGEIGMTLYKNRGASNPTIRDLLREQYEWYTNSTTSRVAGVLPSRYSSTEGLVVAGVGNENAVNIFYTGMGWSYPLAKAWHANGGTSKKVPTPWGALDSVESNASSGIAGNQICLELYNPLTGNGMLMFTGTQVARVLDVSAGAPKGITPEFIMVKNNSTTLAGYAYHAKYNGGVDPADYAISLLSTQIAVNDATAWNDTEPTINSISLGTAAYTNGSNHLMVLYYFGGVEGLQKFDEYTGNGSATLRNIASRCKDGMFLAKSRAVSVGNWPIFDSDSGDNYNFYFDITADGSLGSSFNGVEGFDISSLHANVNANTVEYVYGHFGNELVPVGDIDVYPTDAETSTTDNNIVQIIFKYKGAAALNTELIISATRESTPNWVALTAVQIGTWVDKDGDTWKLIKAEGDISGNAAGTAMRWRIATDESGSETQHDIKDLDFSWRLE